MIRHTSGVICVSMRGPDLDRLKLPPMTAINEDRKKTAYAVSVDARDGISTGISAVDRARTIKVLCDSATEPWEITRPGHVFPLRAVDGGVLVRPGHTEAAVDLASAAHLSPAGVLCELVRDDGSLMRLPDLVVFAREHDLRIISIADLIATAVAPSAPLNALSRPFCPPSTASSRCLDIRAHSMVRSTWLWCAARSLTVNRFWCGSTPSA